MINNNASLRLSKIFEDLPQITPHPAPKAVPLFRDEYEWDQLDQAYKARCRAERKGKWIKEHWDEWAEAARLKYYYPGASD